MKTQTLIQNIVGMLLAVSCSYAAQAADAPAATTGEAVQAPASSQECIPPSFSICTISESCNDGDSYYELKTTFQSVDSIYVDNADTECGLNDDAAADALKKLESQAQDLKEAGLCKVIINNID